MKKCREEEEGQIRMGWDKVGQIALKFQLFGGSQTSRISHQNKQELIYISSTHRFLFLEEQCQVWLMVPLP